MSKNAEEKRTYQRQWKKNHPEKVRADKRLWNRKHREDIMRWEKEHPEKVAEAHRLIRSKHPERVAIYSRIQRRIKKQEIIKPAACSLCGKTEAPIESHHPNYTRPYDITWLCRACHKFLHRKVAGVYEGLGA